MDLRPWKRGKILRQWNIIIIPLRQYGDFCRPAANAQFSVPTTEVAAHTGDALASAGIAKAAHPTDDGGLEGSSVDFSVFQDLVKSNQSKVNRLFARMLEILG